VTRGSEESPGRRCLGCLEAPNAETKEIFGFKYVTASRERRTSEESPQKATKTG